MGMRVTTNIAGDQRSKKFDRFAKTNQRFNGETCFWKPYRHKAADDAAGLAISEGLKAQIRSAAQASRNANDGISMVQTAEGGLNEIGNIVVRLRELGIQAASDTVGETERGMLNKEVVPVEIRNSTYRFCNYLGYYKTFGWFISKI